MSSRAVQKTPSKNSGRWTEEEREKFLQGFEKFGNDYSKLEEYIGTRSQSQIKTHYYHYSKTQPELFSPEKAKKTPKKRSSTSNTESAPSKKSKTGRRSTGATPAASKTKNKPSAVKKHDVQGAPVTVTSSKAAAASAQKNEASSDDDSEKFDKRPPPLPKTTVTAGTKGKKSKGTPVKTPTTTGDADVVGDSDADVHQLDHYKESVKYYLKKEEVQGVIAGILGFFVVLAVKKFFM
mmetsp:Transcript_9428/g.15144  ORF Transcript_9428/g.15144 Transcript_9428/m.15144 type:complete len:237 (-) Transcript_9428:237-947(-)